MSAIAYTANARAPLITTTSPPHTEGNDYAFDVKSQAYGTNIEMPKKTHVSIGGNVETVLRSIAEIHSIALVFPNTLQAQMREFLYSVAAGETFSYDPFGTVAVPDAPFDVALTSQGINELKIQHGETPWRTVNLLVRPV